MNDARAGLIVLLFRAPQILEGAEGSKNGTTDPDGVLALRRSNNLDLHEIVSHLSAEPKQIDANLHA